jgi:hypothetical protein
MCKRILKMTAAIKNNPWEFFIVVLLGVIITMGGYYINRLTVIQDEMGKEIRIQGQIQRNIAGIVADDPDTKAHQSNYLYDISHQTRGGSE